MKGVAIKEHMEVMSSGLLAAKCHESCRRSTAGMGPAAPLAGTSLLPGAAKYHECCTCSSAPVRPTAVLHCAAFHILLGTSPERPPACCCSAAFTVSLMLRPCQSVDALGG